MSPDELYRHGELLFDMSDLAAEHVRDNKPMTREELTHLERTLRVVAFQIQAAAVAPRLALADTLAAIEAEAARGVVVRFPQRAHSDALHGDGQVA